MPDFPPISFGSMNPNVSHFSTQAFTENVIVIQTHQNFKSFWSAGDYYLLFLFNMEKSLIWQTKALHALDDNTDLFARKI